MVWYTDRVPATVVISHADDAAQLLRWASHFALSLDRQILLLHPVRHQGPARVSTLALDDPDTTHPIAKAVRNSAEDLEALGETVVLKELRHPDPVAAILQELTEAQAELLIIPRTQPLKGEEAELSMERQLFKRAPCRTMHLRCGSESGRRCQNLLVAAAGGPHATDALRLAVDVCRANQGRVTALYVEPEVGDEAELVGERILDRIIRKALGESPQEVRTQVVLANSVYDGIRSLITEDLDLLVVGASKQGVVRRVLFGTVPSKLLRSPGGPALAVVRAPIPLTSRFRQFVDGWLQTRVPQLERENRLALYERVQSNSRWDFDFITLLSLSTLIASLGLVQDSAAVVIGAMLVAPLMTPLVAAGLALVHGNLFMFRTASRSVFQGFFLAFALSAVAGVAIPDLLSTPQMLARGSPSILDLLIAFFSGLAAAYAMGRPNLSSALPGVAIAAALVPPIATSGLAFAIGEAALALGAALLFLTNIVAIVLGTAFSLWGVGIRSGHRHGKSQSWVWRAALVLLLLTMILGVALYYRPF